MDTLALFWFELKVAQQRLRETFAESQVTSKARYLKSASRIHHRARYKVIRCDAERGIQRAGDSAAANNRC